MKKMLAVIIVGLGLGYGSLVLASSACNSARECVCIAESTPVCKKLSGQTFGVCDCIPKRLPGVNKPYVRHPAVRYNY